jgi:hypothetical protein
MLSSAVLIAQATSVSGHWEGSFAGPTGKLAVQVDLTRSAQGELTGTLSTPQVQWLPLTQLILEADRVSFEIPASGGARFEGVVSADGQSMSGEFINAAGAAPATLVRTGDARAQARLKSAAVGKAFEGVWNGVLDVEGQRKRIVLKLANHADGSSIASIVSVDDGGLEVPVEVAQTGSSLTVAIKLTGASIAVSLDAAGTELTGTYTERQFQFPIAFRR